MNIEIRRLDNGIPVLMENIDSVSTVSLGIFVNTGSRNEYPDESGVSHFIEHMMFKGTKTRSAKEISELIDNEGGLINAYTSRDMTAYYIQMLSSKIDTGIDVLSDMFLNSTFTQENLDKERNVIIEEIRMYDDIPEEIVHDENVKYALTGVQSNIVLGTIESLNNITREKFLKYFDEQYVASNLVVSVAGKIDYDHVVEELNKGLGKFRDSNFKRDIDASFTINNGENRIKRETNQVHLCFNTRGNSQIEDMKYPGAIISSVLAGNMSSRLFQKIREERGLAYSVYSYGTAFIEGGLFTIYAGTTKESYQEVIDIIKDEFEDIKKNGITPYELQKSKNQFLSMLTFSLENSKGKMTRMASTYMLCGRVTEIDEIISKIENITLEDIKKTAEYLFQEEFYSCTILGDI